MSGINDAGQVAGIGIKLVYSRADFRGPASWVATLRVWILEVPYHRSSGRSPVSFPILESAAGPTSSPS